ncbi:hypothetical protein T4D_6296 [Trichinella pseudospiralis]|uniref:Uncharacterized protein n=1 Tax=Trichinella pseudospiralis TaxID=6337 RepID=A0A0V1F9F2_TRIPS|nr:hypothetical protein T4D_6296 [Trichinella pseudospiralis]
MLPYSGNDLQAGISFQMIRKASQAVLTLELSLLVIFGLVFLKILEQYHGPQHAAFAMHNPCLSMGGGIICLWAAACRTLPCLTVAYRWERGIICFVRANYIGIAALASTKGDFT